MKIQSLQRAVDILSLFSIRQPSLSLGGIAAAMSLNKSTAWGLVNTLLKNRFLEQDEETSKYRLGPAIYKLGMIYSACLEINEKAYTPAHELASRCNITTRIGIWDLDAVLITMTIIPEEKEGMTVQVGPRIPGYCTALGKAILSYLDPNKLKEYMAHLKFVAYTESTIRSRNQLLKDLKAIQQRGYSISIDELMTGVTGIAAPIFQRNGGLAGAISLGDAGFSKVLEERLNDLSAELISTALSISHRLGFGPDSV